MTDETFKTYYHKAGRDYAYEHVKAGNWKEDGAVEKAKEQFEQLLPDGLATNGHFLFSVLSGGDLTFIVSIAAVVFFSIPC